MLPQHKTWSVFVLSSVVQGYKPGQDEVNLKFAIILPRHEVKVCVSFADVADIG
jgi:hypothetical protein